MKNIYLTSQQGDEISQIIRNEWSVDGVTLLLETALLNIRDEIAEEYDAGTVKPFVEGEPIGTIQPPRRFVPDVELPEKRWIRRQEELRELRAKNDRRLAVWNT